MTLKLSRAGTLLPVAEAKIDAHFAALINAELGPMASLHALKRAQAMNGGGWLLEGDTVEAVLARADEQDTRIKELDDRRRAFKASVRSAATAAEINTILGELA